MKLNKKELEAIAKLADVSELDQEARYRDSAGRSLTEIRQGEVDYKLHPGREGLMFYDNQLAELEAKRNDPRYTNYI